MPPKRRCQYGSRCFITDPAHLKVYLHDFDKPPVAVIDLVNASPSLSPIVSSSPPLLDVVSPGVVMAGSDSVLQLTPGSPELQPEDRHTRLKKRRMVIHSSESSGEGGPGDTDFRNFLRKGAFEANASVATDGSTDRVVSQWMSAKTKRSQPAGGAPGKSGAKKARAKQDDDDEGIELESSESDGEVDDENEERLDCPYCTRSFDDWHELEGHVKTHKQQQGGPQSTTSSTSGAPKSNRSGRLVKRNELKTRPPAMEVAPKAAAKPEGPKTMAQLVAACKTFAGQLEADLLDPSKQKQMIRQQPQTFSAGRRLKGHQIVGLNWLYLLHERNHNGILADEMGLGKTVQAIALLTHLKEIGQDGSAIIVVPASVVSNWLAEIERWSPSLNTVLYYGSRDERLALQMDVEDGELGKVDVFLTTYTTVINDDDRQWLRKRRAQYLIIDEAHEIRNSDSLRHKALAKLGTSRRLLLTGTPLHNNLQELCSLLYFLNPTLFGSFKSFENVLEDVGHLSAKEAQDAAIPAIRTVLAPFLLRRLKDEVLQLPEKKRFRIRCALAEQLQKEVYEQIVEGSKKQWGEGGTQVRAANNILMELRKAASHPLLLSRVVYSEETAEAIARIMHRQVAPYYDMERQKVLDTVAGMSDYQLHAICAANDCLKSHVLQPDILSGSSGKVTNLLKLLKQCRSEGKRVLVFSQMTRFLDIVQEVLTQKGISLLRLDGQTPVLERQGLIDQFDSDASISVFLLSTKAGGIGITLTAAQVVVFLDLSFNPQWDRQAEDRAHRIGQEQEVSVYRLLATGTIDESIYAVQQEKLALHNDVLQEGAPAAADDDADEKPADVKNLLARYFEGVK